jgi:antitoxin ParD1/3/4
MAQLNISVPQALKAWIDARVAEGRFSSVSDYVRDLVRRDQDHARETEWLQAMVDEGRASPLIDRDPADVLKEVIADSRARRG